VGALMGWVWEGCNLCAVGLYIDRGLVGVEGGELRGGDSARAGSGD